MNLIECPSPNFDARPSGTRISMLLLHYTGMPSVEEALRRLTDPASQVSAHYLIDEAGSVYRLVPEGSRAWHAGVSYWKGTRNVNGVSIGIELANPGHEFGYREFPEAQMASLEALARDIVTRHDIPAERVLAHSDVAPGRKLDPGERFNWERLARAGVGLWPSAPRRLIDNPRPFGPGSDDPSIGETKRLLARFGYEVGTSDRLDAATVPVIEAFQRHFRPARIDGWIDNETLHLAAALAAPLS